jgi:hypothetical protein
MCGFIDKTFIYIIKLADFYLLEKVIAMRQWRGIVSVIAAMAMIGGIRRLRTVAGAGRVFEIPAKARRRRQAEQAGK